MSHLDSCRVRIENEDGSVTFSAERYLPFGYIHDEASHRLTVAAGPLPTNKAGQIEGDAIPAEGMPLQVVLIPSAWLGSC